MDKITQITGFEYGAGDKCYLLVALTESGDVLLSEGDGKWASVGPKPTEITRKVYNNSSDWTSYLRAKFAERQDNNGLSFSWEGHRWAYRVSSFDQAGNYDLIYRTAEETDNEH